MLFLLFIIPLVVAKSITSVSSASSTTDEFVTVKFTRKLGGHYFDTPVNFANGGSDGSGTNIQLRLDLLQPEMWVMNGDTFFNCSHIASWWASETSMYSAVATLPPSVTTAPEYLADVCAASGVYYTHEESQPTATINGIQNGDPYTLPYLNVINASGSWETDNLYLNTTQDEVISFDNFTFVNVNSTFLSVGGFGVAGSPEGSGFLNLLRDQGYIKSPGYSLWFNNDSAELLPGIVDKKYYTGDLYEFDVVPHQGLRYPKSDAGNSIVGNLNIPSIQLDSIDVVNEYTKESVSLTNGPLGVVFDSRTTYNFLPLDIIINLAIQTNAFFVLEVDRWIVQCSQILESNATLNFRFGNFKLNLPLGKFLNPASYNDKTLKFNDGEEACYLSFLPSSHNGVAALGLDILEEIYLAVDNEGGKIAIASAKKDRDNEEESISTSHSSINGTTSSSTTVDYIRKGTIPFATTTSRLPQVYLSYSEVGDATNESNIPARFTASVISGEFFITGTSNGRTFLESTANPATASSRSKNGANSINNPLRMGQGDTSTTLVAILFTIALAAIGLCTL
jgi:hypothetical protein